MNWDCRIAAAERSRQRQEVARLYTSRKPDRVVVDDLLWAECWREVLAR